MKISTSIRNIIRSASKNLIKKIKTKLKILLFWLAIWEIANRIVANRVLMVGPFATVERLFQLASEAAFWQAITFSLGRILFGFTLAFVVGIVMAAFASIYPAFKLLMLPALNVLKSIPVASFVVLAILWVGGSNLAVFISFVTVLPIVYFNAYSGIQNTDPQLLEMAALFKVSTYKKIRHIYFYCVAPYVMSAASTGFGFAWKSGIAAELIGVAQHTIGFNLHMARIFLQTADLFAWTLTIVLLSFCIEKIFLYFFERFSHDNS
ncbi:MAG: ABC transporter permease subunit [Defluviitaleaceae bacterium]|nr:ABC transporter permease subunit [Defluviitaleaceae bacterium]